MIEIVVAVLRLPDGRIVFQRRDEGAPTSAGLLGFFGGHVEPEDADTEQTILRELGEETSLDINALEPKYIDGYKFETDAGEGRRHYKFSVYEVSIESREFSVYEGVGSEVYTREKALARDDLTISTRYMLKEFVKE